MADPQHASAVGIDFGTTNSSVALQRAAGDLELLRFAHAGESAASTASSRSVLYLEQVKTAGRARLDARTGAAAIDAYLHAEHKGRLIQSLKSYLSSRLFTTTEIFGRRYSPEELIARILGDLRQAAEQQFGRPITAAVAGRPVQFVGAETEEDNAFALARLETAFRLAGFASVTFVMEPVAAAAYYESTLTRDELILIGDFGGGTSDFSLLHVGPGVRKRGRTTSDLLGNAGVGLAGDAFDARIVRHLVSPMLGAGSLERPVSKSLLAVPNWVYTKLEHWHHLSFLRTRAVTEMLRGARVRACEPEKIEALLTLIEEDLGYRLHQAVQRTKMELSQREEAEFRFLEGGLEIRAHVSRQDFESWIAEELAAVEQCVDRLLENCGVPAQQVDRVFLTGGTSFVPAVRRIFTSRFGAERVVAGNEFTSVALGLALFPTSTV